MTRRLMYRRGFAAATILPLVMLIASSSSSSSSDGAAEANITEFQSSAVNPGFKFRVSATGLNYAAGVAVDVLAKRVMSLKIPDQSGTAKTPVGKVKYEISDMRITYFGKPSTAVTVDPKTGLTWTLLNTRITINGRWRYKWHIVKDHGTFDLSISARRILTISAIFGQDASGHVTISSTGCMCNIDSLKVRFHGGASWLYNLFSKKIAKPIQKALQGQLCQEARKAIDVNARSRLATLPVAITILNRWVLDYRLVSPPVFQHGFVESFHKGEFFLKNNITEAPFQAAPFPPSTATDRMVNIWISDYMLNSMSYVLFKNNILKHTLTRNDMPPEDKGFLNTTCTSLECFGFLIPQAATAYPNASVEMEMAASSYPIASVSTAGLKGRGFGTVACRAKLNNGSVVPLFKTNVSVEISLTASLSDMILRGNITEITSVIRVTESQIGQISGEILTTLSNVIAKTVAIPRLNVICQKGIPIPGIKDVRFVNTRLENDDHCLRISTDVKYVASEAEAEAEAKAEASEAKASEEEEEASKAEASEAEASEATVLRFRSDDDERNKEISFAN